MTVRVQSTRRQGPARGPPGDSAGEQVSSWLSCLPGTALVAATCLWSSQPYGCLPRLHPPSPRSSLRPQSPLPPL